MESYNLFIFFWANENHIDLSDDSQDRMMKVRFSGRLGIANSVLMNLSSARSASASFSFSLFVFKFNYFILF